MLPVISTIITNLHPYTIMVTHYRLPCKCYSPTYHTSVSWLPVPIARSTFVIARTTKVGFIWFPYKISASLAAVSTEPPKMTQNWFPYSKHFGMRFPYHLQLVGMLSRLMSINNMLQLPVLEVLLPKCCAKHSAFVRVLSCTSKLREGTWSAWTRSVSVPLFCSDRWRLALTIYGRCLFSFPYLLAGLWPNVMWIYMSHALPKQTNLCVESRLHGQYMVQTKMLWFRFFV